MNLMITMINLIDVIPYMNVMTDISALDNHQCHWNSIGNKVGVMGSMVNSEQRHVFWFTDLHYMMYSIPFICSYTHLPP